MLLLCCSCQHQLGAHLDAVFSWDAVTCCSGPHRLGVQQGPFYKLVTWTHGNALHIFAVRLAHNVQIEHGTRVVLGWRTTTLWC